jgi:hypothetical protein
MGDSSERAEELVHATAALLSGTIMRSDQCLELATNLYLLEHVHGRARDPRVEEIHRMFRRATVDGGCAGVLDEQLRYGSRLASAPGSLEYEELHKLLSIADHVEELRALGLEASAPAIARFEADLRIRLGGQAEQARLVAEDRAEDWNRTRWWYAENLA